VAEIGKSNKAAMFGAQEHYESLQGATAIQYLELTRLAGEFGSKYVAMLRLPRAGRLLSEILIYSNWPEKAVGEITQFSPAMNEELTKRTTETIAPFEWSCEVEAPALVTDTNRNITNLLRELRLFDGIIIPVHGPARNIGFVIIGALESKLNSQQIALLQSKSIELFDQYFKAGRMELEAKGKLTHHEVKVLQFLIDGKSTDEIADIIGLSSVTVGIHASSAKSKLSSSTKIQAVAQAMRNGLIG